MDERVIFCLTLQEKYKNNSFQYGFAGKNDFAGKRFILKITSGEITNDVWWEN